ncbi:MAG: TIR domain-containing protein, partial [Acidobacteria bacterium]|nr:TIR domain-containing protein [Acidobacteriota bacterium]
MSTSSRRFRVALSFPGEHRARVKAIAELLGKQLGERHVLYDQWHQAEFARPNLDIYLPRLYHDASDLIVFFFCAAYSQKEWCGLEWRAGRDLLKGKQDDRLMFLKLDKADIEGLYSIDGYIRIEELTAQDVATLILQRLDMLTPAPSDTQYEAYTNKLPATDSTLIGRAAELKTLEDAWKNGTNLVQVIAPGGTGKTALMTKWYKCHVGEAPIYGWSFYKQGTGDNANVSSDEFLNHAIGWFQVQPKANTAEAKAEVLVHYLRQHQTLLILDGLEPLQNQTTGECNDYALKDLLRELSVQNAGLVLCTSRVTLADLPDVPPLELDNLTEADGALPAREVRSPRQRRGPASVVEGLRQSRPGAHSTRYLHAGPRRRPLSALRNRRPAGVRHQTRPPSPAGDAELRAALRGQARGRYPARPRLLRPSRRTGGADTRSARPAAGSRAGEAA